MLGSELAIGRGLGLLLGLMLGLVLVLRLGLLLASESALRSMLVIGLGLKLL